MQALLGYISSPKNPINLMTDYMDWNEVPRTAQVKKDTLLFNAWMMTGKHLQEAMNIYGKEIQEQNKSSSSPEPAKKR